jgi:hypothetical protein
LKLKIISTALWICFFCLQIFSATIIVIPSDTVYASISAGVADAQPGDTVLVRAGKYTAGAYLGSNNGTEGKMITIKNYPGEMPEINGWKDESTVNGGSAFSNPQDKPVNFVRIEGFYVTGFQFGALSINWKDNADKASYIAGNNVEARYNVVDLCGQNGMSIFFTKNVTLENNLVSRTGWKLDSWSSGINLLSDGGVVVVRNNISFHHIDISSNRSDGNGFIIDQSFSKLTSALFENNLSFLNGGSGFGTTSTSNVSYIGNTAYNNFQDANFANGSRKAAGLSFSNTESRNTKTIQNNILIQANRGDPIAVYGSTVASLKNVKNNFTSTSASDASSIFVDAANCNFRLKAGASNVIGKGAADGIAASDIGFDYRAIKMATDSHQSFYAFAPDTAFIRSKGGLAGCFKPVAHKSPPSIGAYEYSDFDPTAIHNTNQSAVISFSKEAPTRIAVVDLVGRTIYKSDNLHRGATERQLTIPVNGFSRGAYFVKIRTAKGTVVRKMVRM